jgi:hypothetical protein
VLGKVVLSGRAYFYREDGGSKFCRKFVPVSVSKPTTISTDISFGALRLVVLGVALDVLNELFSLHFWDRKFHEDGDFTNLHGVI